MSPSSSRSGRSRTLLTAFALALGASASAACGASSNPHQANDPTYEEAPGNPGAVSTVNEYTAPTLGGSHAVPGDPPAGNPALDRPPAVTTTTVTSATVRRRVQPANVVVAPSDIGATGGSGTVSEGAGGSSGTDTPAH